MKSYPTEVVLSLSTGVLLCDFSKMHELTEYLCGGPVFTHQFAFKPFNEELQESLFTQHPQLRAVDSSKVDKSNWQSFRDGMIVKLGPSLSISPMSEWKTANASFTEPLRGKSVIAVETN